MNGKSHEVLSGQGRSIANRPLQDLYDAARLVDSLEHLHFFQRCMVARDIEDPRVMDLNTVPTPPSPAPRKHCGVSYRRSGPCRGRIASCCTTIAGGEEALAGAALRQPFLLLRGAAHAFCRGCLPGHGGLHQAAVCRCCSWPPDRPAPPAPPPWAAPWCRNGPRYSVRIGLRQCASCPKHPCICGPWPFVSDLRTGAMSGGSGEQAVLMAACGQMGRYYDLPTGIAAGMADSKIPGCAVRL